MKMKTMLVLLVVLCLSSVARADVFTVNSTDDNPDASLGSGGCKDANGKCTLRAAIEEANTHYDYGADKDFIVLPSGQYVLNGFIEIKPGKLKIFGTGIDVPQINGQNSVNIFVINKKAIAEINNIWITGGKVQGPGAAVNNSGQLTLKNVTIEDSEGTIGGGISNYSEAKLVISDSVIKDNEASDEGGGIYNHLNAMLIVTNTEITGNKAKKDGGGISNHGDMELEGIEISGNTADGNGGGLFNVTDKDISLYKSTITNNVSSGEGGGIYNTGVMDVMNCTISGNKALTYGGGVYATGKKGLMLAYVTIADNDAGSSGGGIQSTGIAGADEAVSMSNTILAGNRFGGKKDANGADCSGRIKSFGYNILGNGSNCQINAVNSDQVGTSKALLDPMITSLGDYGGSTDTHDLLPGSPAFDKGMCIVNADQRDVKRPKGKTCDIGAVEHEDNANYDRAKATKPK